MDASRPASELADTVLAVVQKLLNERRRRSE
jgi:hypothetical protein